MSYQTDFHVHIALKAANNDSIRDIWQYRENKPPKKFLFYFNVLRRIALDNIYRQYSTETQYDLGNCVNGNVRLVNCTLYPIERQYIARRNGFIWLLSSMNFFTKKFPFIQLWNKKRNLLTTLVQVMVGTSEKRALEFWDEQQDLNNEVDYFSDYLNEFDHLWEVHDVQPLESDYETKVFRLVRNYEELQENIGNPDVISGIVNLEGIHGLATYQLSHLFKASSIEDLNPEDKNAFMQRLQFNLRRIKEDQWKCPFYVTFAHHYNNLLVGHARSFKGLLKLVFKQENGLNKGLTQEGELIVDRLLMRSQTMKRILIDTKHMSVKARSRFYEIIEDRNTNLDDGELGIPVICSHGAVSAERDLASAQKVSCDKKADKNSYVSRCDVNLCDEDILRIYDSDGLIGILMHDGRMPGKRYWKAFKAVEDDIPKRKLLQQQLFLTNVYHIVSVIYQRDGGNGWKCITLGSDMDGLIDPFDDYDSAKDIDNFRNDIYRYLEDYEQLSPGFRIKNLQQRNDGMAEYTKNQIQGLNQGQSIKEIVDGIFFKNLDVFLSKYFSKAYLFGEKREGPNV